MDEEDGWGEEERGGGGGQENCLRARFCMERNRCKKSRPHEKVARAWQGGVGEEGEEKPDKDCTGEAV